MSADLVVSVDAMGGDHAPGAEIGGLKRALIRHPKVRFLVYGDSAVIGPIIDKDARLKSVCEIRHAPARVTMDDKPSHVMRRGQDTSMWKAIEAVKGGEAKVMVSAGNTGALMAVSLLQLRPMKGISRPALAALWPTLRGEAVVLDMGANVESSARELVDFAVMGANYARVVLGVERPRVGLVNVGAEDLKGTPTVRDADAMLKRLSTRIDYRGYAEGSDIMSGKYDVCVMDGFSGNVALKASEGTARQIATYLRSAARRSLFSQLGFFFASGAFKVLREKMDPRKSNGAVFLGLNGVVVKSHGGTDDVGFANALDVAVDMAGGNYGAEIAAAIDAVNEDLAKAGREPAGQEADTT